LKAAIPAAHRRVLHVEGRRFRRLPGEAGLPSLPFALIRLPVSALLLLLLLPVAVVWGLGRVASGATVGFPTCDPMGSAWGKKGPVRAVRAWVWRQPRPVKAVMGLMVVAAALVLIWLVVHDRDNLFVAAETCHFAGVAVLVYKLAKNRTCAGLSLKTQELTAMFLAVRLYCSFVMEYNIHTVLDTATLVTTVWVIYMIRYKLRSSYMKEKDNFTLSYVIVPCALLALNIHPSLRRYHFLDRVAWAFCVYLEAVSVLPQLRVMQNTMVRVVESLTAHYVFALGVARFLSCAHWILQNLDGKGYLWTMFGIGLWPYMAIASEIVQTFILADFCYYYVKRLLDFLWKEILYSGYPLLQCEKQERRQALPLHSTFNG
ncbi:hypothetical protein Taro_055179, partial [Colocasia esculenta]|nr:hypothetical protein [Colocasia esculenta]